MVPCGFSWVTFYRLHAANSRALSPHYRLALDALAVDRRVNASLGVLLARSFNLCLLSYPSPIRPRSLALLAVSLTTSNLILDPNWILLVGLLLSLLLLVLIVLAAAARFVQHRWKATRTEANSTPALGLKRNTAVALRYKNATRMTDACSRSSSKTQIIHYRLRDDLLDTTVRNYSMYLQ